MFDLKKEHDDLDKASRTMRTFFEEAAKSAITYKQFSEWPSTPPKATHILSREDGKFFFISNDPKNSRYYLSIYPKNLKRNICLTLMIISTVLKALKCLLI